MSSWRGVEASGGDRSHEHDRGGWNAVMAAQGGEEEFAGEEGGKKKERSKRKQKEGQISQSKQKNPPRGISRSIVFQGLAFRGSAAGF